MSVHRYEFRDRVELSEDGDFVTYSDYAAIKAEVERLRRDHADICEELDARSAWAFERDKVKADIKRLRGVLDQVITTIGEAPAVRITTPGGVSGSIRFPHIGDDAFRRWESALAAVEKEIQ